SPMNIAASTGPQPGAVTGKRNFSRSSPAHRILPVKRGPRRKEISVFADFGATSVCDLGDTRYLVRDIHGTAITTTCECVCQGLLARGCQLVGYGRRRYVSVPLVWRDVLADSARREAQQAYIESLRPDRDVAPRACKSVDPPRRLAPAFGGKRLVERDRLLHKSDSVIEMVISAMGETQQQVSTRQRTKPK